MVTQTKAPSVPWASGLIACIVCTMSWWAWDRASYPLDAASAIAVGARDNWALSLGQSWRLITAGLIHSDAQHLMWNLIPSIPALILLERRMGGLKTLGLTAFGLTLGHAVGAMFFGGTSVGFSPALFAIITGFAVIDWQHKPRLARFAVLYLTVGLLASLRFVGVDLASHLGGVLAGLTGGLLWRGGFGAQGLLLCALIPMVSGFPLKTTPTSLWSLPKQGLTVGLDSSWTMAPNGSKRCSPANLACVHISTHTAARRSDQPPWNVQCQGAITAPTGTQCITLNQASLCLHKRRGLYDHSVCLESEHPNTAHLWRRVIRSIDWLDPRDPIQATATFNAALRAHRLGQTTTARLAYQKAMIEAPGDARLPFLAAILELDFGEGPSHAEPLALHATVLDPLHPDGKALLHEIRQGLEP